MTDNAVPPAAPYDLLTAGYDLALGRHNIVGSYVICSTPRSGSTLLAEAMHQTGELGIPAEYIDVGETVPYLYNRWGCTGLEDYVSRVHGHRTSDTGLFGLETHWHQLQQFATVSQGAEPFADINFAVLHAVLQQVAPRPAYIYVTRRDKAQQAVSHWLAANTRLWINLDDESVTTLPDHDPDGIGQFTAGIDAVEEYWEKFFTLAGVDPLRVVYEDFAADYDDTVRRAAAHAGIEPSDLSVPPSRMRRQSNEQSREYAERYPAELGL